VTDYSRRGVLAGSAAGLAALAGCSSLPFTGGSDARPEYDGEAILDALDAEQARAATSPEYPGRVPDSLAATHRERAGDLLEEVPENPDVPNAVVAERLADARSDAESGLADAPADTASLDALDDWRHARSDAAYALGSHAAATAAFDREALAERARRIERDFDAFRSEWRYRASDAPSALLAHRELESLAATCQRALVPDRALPADPQTAPFAVGERVQSVETARAALADATGLRNAFVTDDMATYRDALAVTAERARRVGDATIHPVDDIIYADSGEAFDRDIADSPARVLFESVTRSLDALGERVHRDRERGHYAAAASGGVHLMTRSLSAVTLVDAIERGEYATPESGAAPDAVAAARTRAVDAVENAQSASPQPLAAVAAEPASVALAAADRELLGLRAAGRTPEPPDRFDVVDALASYARATHLADAAPQAAARAAELLDSAPA
jgi:hypothetical protein